MKPPPRVFPVTTARRCAKFATVTSVNVAIPGPLVECSNESEPG
jgi:hypothetical protein